MARWNLELTWSGLLVTGVGILAGLGVLAAVGAAVILFGITRRPGS